jgi:hypothetical protein
MRFFATLAVGLAAAVNAATALAAPGITATPDSFGSGQTVTVDGAGFAPSVSVGVWFDANDNVLQDSNEPSAVAQTDSSGAFSGVTLLVKSSPGQHFIRAGNPAVARASVSIGTCWFMDEGCFIDGRQTRIARCSMRATRMLPRATTSATPG